jgi:hypothetical protein
VLGLYLGWQGIAGLVTMTGSSVALS